jgi:hypothetical protein
MFRLIQVMRNLFIRIEGLLTYQLRKLFGFLAQIFGFFGKLFGFTQESQYFLEDQAQNIKQVETKQPVEPTKTSSDTTTTRRRPDANMDYYLKLAQPKKTSK